MTGAASAPDALRIHAIDDVAVMLRDAQPGDAAVVAGFGSLSCNEPIARGHKLALRALPAGAIIRKFGMPIGRTSRAISAGDWVHEHNLVSSLEGLYSVDRAPVHAETTAQDVPQAAAFNGYRRADGRVGTRNQLWIIPTVGCVARTAERLAAVATQMWAGSIDGVVALPHPFGCSQLGTDLDDSRRVLAALATHPNAGGVLLLGLGCESNQLAALRDLIPAAHHDRLRSFNAQQCDDEHAAGMAALADLAEQAGAARREPCSLADLRLGMKCGGSDALSGLTANPLLGRLSEIVIAAGGSAMLTEIPEMFGAEASLTARARTTEIANEFAELINRFRRYYADQGEPLDANPSPGNRHGGITTLEEKALGAVQKGGRAPLTHVLRYGEVARIVGLGVVEAPGNDAVSCTALVAAGANLILFTTGRGTPLGAPVPTLKIASTTALARAKPRWIDFDAGAVLDVVDATAPVQALLELVLRTAGGALAANERNDERSIAIWKRGVTL